MRRLNFPLGMPIVMKTDAPFGTVAEQALGIFGAKTWEEALKTLEKFKLGALPFLLPLYNPLRLIEELCMLDHLSHGRLALGIGRGISPDEFRAMGENIAARRRCGRGVLHASVAALALQGQKP